jgi:hypothetical protein
MCNLDFQMQPLNQLMPDMLRRSTRQAVRCFSRLAVTEGKSAVHALPVCRMHVGHAGSAIVRLCGTLNAVMAHVQTGRAVPSWSPNRDLQALIIG